MAENLYTDISLMDLNQLAEKIRESTVDVLPSDLADQLIYLDAQQNIALIKARYEDRRPAPTIRVRCNTDYTAKGILTASSTIEYDGDLRDADLNEIMEMRLRWTALVNEAYPPPPMDEATKKLYS